MLTDSWRCIRPAVLLAGILLLGLLLLPVHILSAFGSAQGDAEPVDITEKECVFWSDFDNDGEGDEEVNTGPDKYTRQETVVVGGCTFQLNTRTAATLIVESELDDWRSRVEIAREPALPEKFTLHPSRNEISGLEGGMRVSVNHTGATPRSVKSRTLRDGYEHEVQVPRQFRLLEITVITPAGKQDRLEESVQSASNAYIEARRRISERTNAAAGESPDALTALAGELLGKGYPEIAESVLELKTDYAGSSAINWWMWITIALAIIIVASIFGFGIIYWLSRRPSPEPAPPSEVNGRRNRM